MIHTKLPGLMGGSEMVGRAVGALAERVSRAQTAPSGSVSFTNADGTRTVVGAANASGSTLATHVGDTEAPGRPTGLSAVSGGGCAYVAWDGTLEGGVPADFDHVTVWLSVMGQEEPVGELAARGVVSTPPMATAAEVEVWATAEDDCCLADGTPAHNVSARSDVVSLAIEQGDNSAAIAALRAQVEQAGRDAGEAKALAREAGAAAGSVASTRMLVAASATPAAVAAKAATLRAGTLTLAAGASVTVVFDEANTAASPTLDVGGTGARPMMTNGAPYAYWVAGTAVSLVFDGSFWQVCSVPVYASEATVGNPAAGNVLVDADSVDVRDGTAVLASFGADTVSLGANGPSSRVLMCGGRAWVSYDDTSGAASLRGASAVLVGAPRLAELSAQGAGAGRYAHAVCDDSDGTAGVLLAAGDGAGHSASLALNGSEGTLSLRAPGGVSVNGSAVDLSDTGWVPVYASADGRYFVRWRARRGVCYLLWDQTGVGQGGWYAPDPIPREYLPEAAMYLPSAVYGANSTGSVWVPARSDPGGRPWLSCYDASARLVGSASWPYAAAR